MVRDVLHRRAEEITLGCECGPNHPVEREEGVHENQGDEHVKRHAPNEALERPAFRTTPCRQRFRSGRALGSDAHCSSTRMKVT